MHKGISIWLDVPLEALAQRIAAVGTNSRPLLHDGESGGDPYTVVMLSMICYFCKRVLSFSVCVFDHFVNSHRLSTVFQLFGKDVVKHTQTQARESPWRVWSLFTLAFHNLAGHFVTSLLQIVQVLHQRTGIETSQILHQLKSPLRYVSEPLLCFLFMRVLSILLALISSNCSTIHHQAFEQVQCFLNKEDKY